ncbi:MAG: nitronate monooxygenase [Victivallales bacterium]|jgi:enoyl-[acyl-carrier protein] reductase II|nr:nitronate monooxygenase [Victivallales bacterium]
MKVSPELDKMMQKGRDFLGCEYPIICGAMTWVSEPNLVSAVCNAGGFASLAGGNAPADILKQQVAAIREMTDKPFGVNLITIAPNYRSHLELLGELKIPYIIFAGSFPKKEEIEIAKASGAKVMCFASTLSIAKRMIRFGSDAIILEGSEAGGHIGHVALSVLLQQVLFEVRDQIPVFVAGGIATGKMLAHVMLMGAAGVQLGTRFVMTEESRVHENFKNVFKRANARDAVSTPQYDSKLPVVAVRALRNKGTDAFGKLQLKLLKQLETDEISREEAQNEVETFWIGALRQAAVDGDVERGSLMAGQSVGLVDQIVPVSALLQELMEDAGEEIKLIKEKINCL